MEQTYFQKRMAFVWLLYTVEKVNPFLRRTLTSSGGIIATGTEKLQMPPTLAETFLPLLLRAHQDAAPHDTHGAGRGAYILLYSNNTTTMKLAEALSLRADLQKRVNELKVRFKDSAKVQEGDTPAEDLAALDVELNTALEELEDLIYRINATNMRTVHEGETVTRLMARKDVLAMRVQLMKEVLSHVVEGDARYGRNEIKTVRVVDVPDLRRRTDAAARELRELDMKIQALNWSVDLIEEDTNK